MSVPTPAAAGSSSPDPPLPIANPSDPPLLPWAFIDCPLPILVDLLSHMLDLLIKHNDQVVLTPDALTRFHSRAAPGITVVDYLRRIVKYTNLEKIPLLSLLAYIDTTCSNLPTFTLSSLTVHRFLIASVCAGSKAQCDVFCTNAHYAKVGGIKTGELNALERELLRVTKWDLCCHAEQLQKYYTSLIRSHGGFVQSPPPAEPPFLPFPRSRSKPRSTTDAGNEDEQMGESDGDDDVGSDEGEGEGEYEDVEIGVEEQGMVVDPATSPGTGERGRARTRRTDHPATSHGGMEVDSSPNVVTATTNHNATSVPDGSDAGISGEAEAEAGPSTSPLSATSSSVPSSSRSSLRGSIRRSRVVSVSDPKLAEPRIDTTPVHAGASVGNSPASALGLGLGPGRKSSLAGLKEYTNGMASGSSSGSGLASSSTNGHPPSTDPETSTAPPHLPALPIPVPLPVSRKASSSSYAGSHSHSHSHSQSGGKLLRSLVGGIFRKKSFPGPGEGEVDGLSHFPAPNSTSQQRQGDGATEGEGAGVSVSVPGIEAGSAGRPQGIVPSRPVRAAKEAPPQPRPQPQSVDPSGGRTNLNSEDHSVPPSPSPVGDGATSRQSTSPRSAVPLAKPVTPRVRTRAERSIDPSDRVALGDPGVSGRGDQVADWVEGKRSKA